MATHDVDLALRWADETALLTPSGVRTGPAAAMLSRTELLQQAGLRLPWGIAATQLLCAHGLLTTRQPVHATRRNWLHWRRRARLPRCRPTADVLAPYLRHEQRQGGHSLLATLNV